MKDTIFAIVVLPFPINLQKIRTKKKKVHPQLLLLVGAAMSGKKFKHAVEAGICLKKFHFPVGATSALAQKEYVIKCKGLIYERDLGW